MGLSKHRVHTKEGEKSFSKSLIGYTELIHRSLNCLLSYTAYYLYHFTERGN